MTFLLTKYAVTAFVIVVVSEIAKRWRSAHEPALRGLIFLGVFGVLAKGESNAP